MSKHDIEKISCGFCGETLYKNKLYDHLPCKGVEAVEKPPGKAKPPVSRGGR